MKYFSTFSGIGGFELGIEQAYENLSTQKKTERIGQKDEEAVRGRKNEADDEGNKELASGGAELEQHDNGSADRQPTCIGYSEIDKYAIQIYERHFNHKNFGDVTRINARDLPSFDCLVGGFPCQSFSIAGKRLGFEDTRGTLFFELARILRDKKPRLFVFENVKGLLSHDNGQTFKTIIATLDELGYDLQWQVLNSKNFGVPQNRERVFIIGHLRGEPRPEVFPIRENGGVSNKEQQERIQREIQANGQDGKQPNPNPTHSNNRVYGADGIGPALRTMQGGNRQPKIFNAHWARSGKWGDGWSDKAFTMDSGVGRDQLVDKIRRLTPVECERLQGFPDGWTDNVSDTQRYKTLGNAVTVNVVREIFKRL